MTFKPFAAICKNDKAIKKKITTRSFVKTGIFSSYISKGKICLHFLFFTVRDFGNLLSEFFSSPSLTSVFVSCAPSSPWRALLSVAIWSVKENLHSAVLICYSPCSLSLHLGFLIVSLMQSCPLALFISSCLAAAPAKTQRPFSNVVPLSPLSPSLLPNLAGSSAALFCFFLVSHLLILQCASVCVWERVCEHVCPQKKKKNPSKGTILCIKSKVFLFFFLCQGNGGLDPHVTVKIKAMLKGAPPSLLKKTKQITNQQKNNNCSHADSVKCHIL